MRATFESVDAFVAIIRRRIWTGCLKAGASLAEADEVDQRVVEVVRRLNPQPVDGELDFQPVLDALEDELGLPRGTFVQDFVDRRAAVAEAENIIQGG